MAYNINIVDGQGTQRILDGQYSVTSSTPGYNNSSIDPANVTVAEGTNTYNFKISATGTLTLHVSEEGTSAGTAVVGAKFIRCDKNGNEYGTEIVSDASGNAVFNNVPYAADDAPIIYYKQKESDGSHTFSTDLQQTTLTSETGTIEITNALPVERTINFTDANYEGLPVTGIINLQ